LLGEKGWKDVDRENNICKRTFGIKGHARENLMQFGATYMEGKSLRRRSGNSL
jgi:hypothetical protein